MQTAKLFRNGRRQAARLPRQFNFAGDDVFFMASGREQPEMQFGVYNSQNIEKNSISLTEFLAPFQIIEFDDRNAEYFGKVRADP